MRVAVMRVDRPTRRLALERVAPALVAGALAGALAVAACGGGGPTAVPTGLPGVPNPGCGFACSSPVTSGACQAIAAPLAELAQVEGQIKAGSIGDEQAEGLISGIQQALENEAQQVGFNSSLGQAIQAVISSLGELGVGLNQNQPPTGLAPQLGALDASLASLASACQAAS